MDLGKTEKELQEATSIKLKNKEDRGSYLKRLAVAANELKDEEWKALSGPAQKWANAAIEAIDEKKDIVEFADGKSEDKEDKKEPEAEDADADDDKKEDDADDKDDKEDDDALAEKSERKKSDKKADKSDKKADKADKKSDKKADKADKKDDKEEKEDGARVERQKLANRVRKLLLKNPKMHKLEILKQVKEDGFDASLHTVGPIRRHFVHSLRFLQEEKLLNKEFKF